MKYEELLNRYSHALLGVDDKIIPVKLFVKENNLMVDYDDTEDVVILLRHNLSKSTLHNYLQLRSDIKNQVIHINEIEGWQPEEYTFAEYLLQLQPEGGEFLSTFNSKLYSELDQYRKAILVSSFGGIQKISDVNFSKTENDFEISGNFELNKSQLKLNPHSSLIIDVSNKYPSVKFVVLEGEMKGNIFRCHNMKYGHQQNMETLKVRKEKVNLVRPILRLGSILNTFLRPQLLFSAIFPLLLGMSYIFFEYQVFDFKIATITLFSLISTLIGINLTIDFFDKSENTKINKSPLSGGKYIGRGLLSRELTIFLGIVFIGLAAVLGLYLNSILNNNLIIILGMTGAILAIFYAASPFKLSYRGFGEIVILVIFGPIPVIASGILQFPNSKILPLILIGIIPGILSASSLVINNLIDYAPDEGQGRRTLVVILGRKRTTLLLQSINLTLPIYIVFITAILQLPNLLFLIMGTYSFILPLNKAIRNNDSEYIIKKHSQLLIFYFMLICLILVITPLIKQN